MSSKKTNTQILRGEVKRLGRLLQIGRTLASDLQLEKLMGRVTEECAIMVGAHSCFIFILDRNSGELWTTVEQTGRMVRLSQSEGIEGWVSVNREYVIIEKPHEDNRFSEKLEKELKSSIKNAIVLPLVNSRGESLGVLEAINKKTGDFETEDYLLLQAAAAQIAMSIENARIYQDLKKTFNSLTEVMAATIDAKHPISKGHSKRVARYSVGIAREMCLSVNEIEQIKIASLLHDYGKIGIPDSILKKNGSLSEVEFEVMKRHAKITHDIVSKVHFAEELADVPIIASCHHERWDGTGYPFGLAREAIPLGSRIIAVADSFDARTTFREYKEPQSFDEAMKEILEESGTHFDPIVVEAFARYYRREVRPKVESGELAEEEPDIIPF